MKVIKKLVSMIDEELSGAQCYAEKYVEMKAENNTKWQNRFKSMSEDELNHAMSMHEYATEKIEKLNEVYRPSEKIIENWNKAHEDYVERYAWIRQMLAM